MRIYILRIFVPAKKSLFFCQGQALVTTDKLHKLAKCMYLCGVFGVYTPT